jgi:A/G-specific adenine glycosylase
MPLDLATPLLNWYNIQARSLPWRGNPDPYAVWVSEIMLQQTRVETVIPYFEHWMRRFPTINSLALASQQDVLAAWEGLGYYGRARNLHRAAQLVQNTMGGKLPADRQALQKLPGIGRYTSGAIASIAFGLDEPTLDGNIRRVLARLFNVEIPAQSPGGERVLWKLAADHLPISRAGDYNQALMDLGAVICLPRLPECLHCPLADFCQARQLGVQEQRPVSLPKPILPNHTVSAAVILRDGKVLIAQRPVNGLLGGMWEFPGGKMEPGEDLQACLRREICEELGVAVDIRDKLGTYRHAYTHFRVTVHAFYCKLIRDDQPTPLQVKDLRWATLPNLATFPMGKIDRRIATDLLAARHDQPSLVS